MTKVNKKTISHDSKKLNSMTTKSSKIRYLNSVGYSRSEIAKLLEIRYQHVRNVLITPLMRDQKK